MMDDSTTFPPETVVFTPVYEDFVFGRVRHMPVLGSRVEWLIMLLLACFAVGAAVICAQAVIDWDQLNRTGVVTEGQMIYRRFKHDDTGGGYKYYIVYRFEAGGETYAIEKLVSQGTYYDFEQNARVQVLYSTENPRNIEIDRGNDFPIAMIAVTIAVEGVAVWVAYSLWKTYRLSRKGRLVKGELVACTGETQGNRFIINAEYRFTAPGTGEEITGKISTRNRGDLRGNLPEPGALVAVIYDAESGTHRAM